MPRKSQGKGIGGHTMANEGANDTWLTPPAVLHALGYFDLDPCAAPSPRPWPTASEHIELPADGLDVDWHGRVWCNPPYGNETPKWVEKMARHGHGTMLIFARVETEYWQQWIWPYSTGILFIAGRLNFCLPDGTRAAGNAGGPSALVAFGAWDAQVLESCEINGAFVIPRHSNNNHHWCNIGDVCKPSLFAL